MTPFTKLFATAALAALPLTATADEVWDTPAGEVIYEQDLGVMAILSFPYAAAFPGQVPEFAQERGTLYFPGLGGNFDDRSIHEGYWLVPGSPSCSVSISAADGQSSQRWGRATVIFDRAAFPTSMTVLVGSCFDDPSVIIRADRP